MSHYRAAEHQLWGVDNYVPAMTMSSHIGDDGVYRMSLGTPGTTDADGIFDGVAADDSGPYTYTAADFAAAGGLTSGELDAEGVFVKAKYGRVITVTGSASGVTQDVTIRGWDYLGQYVVKTLAANGTSAQPFGVAIKRFHSLTVAAGAASETIDVGWNTTIGLPFKTVRVIHEELAGVLSATLGTLTAPVLTDPATVTTLDPRGLYTPNATMDGAKNLVINGIASSWVNSSGNGGLHGIAQYGG